MESEIKWTSLAALGRVFPKIRDHHHVIAIETVLVR